MTYEEQLKTPYWHNKRDEILQRDDYCCQDCLRGKTRLSPCLELHVHHRYYIDGLKAWEYPDELLITLCKECQSQPVKHISEVILDFIKALSNGQ